MLTKKDKFQGGYRSQQELQEERERDRHQHTTPTSRAALPAPTTASSTRLRGAPDSVSPATGRSLPHHLSASTNMVADSDGTVPAVTTSHVTASQLPSGACIRSRTRSTPRVGIPGLEPSSQR